MKQNIFETLLGAVVIVVAVGFLIYATRTANVGDVKGYEIVADFSSVGGLRAGDEVQISGVKVGQVARVELDGKAYLARVVMTVDNAVKLPSDTAATITSASLLGGKTLSLIPGGAEDMLEAGGKVEYTQAPQNLEELLGKFIFSVQDNKKNDQAAGAPATP